MPCNGREMGAGFYVEQIKTNNNMEIFRVTVIALSLICAGIGFLLIRYLWKKAREGDFQRVERARIVLYVWTILNCFLLGMQISNMIWIYVIIR